MPSESPVRRIETPAGRFVGVQEHGVLRIRGIRYASAVRFEPPVPEPLPEEEIPAVDPAPACPQPASRGDRMLGDPYRGIRFDEDCLRLSITVPDDLRAEERVPVLVWIHGGSYVAGAGDLPIFDPAVLVREQRVLVVAVTFRLGVLGFLGDGETVPPNLGLLDLLEALRWIRRHVGGFGGDPGSVTLFGQSAGGDAVAHLLVAGEGLFDRAIIQSAPFGIRRRRGRMTARMLAAVGRLDPAGSEELLFAAHDRAYAAARRSGLRSGMPFGPQYGFAPLPAERRMDAAWRRAAPTAPVLVGWTAEETAFFGAVSPTLSRVFRVPLAGPVLRRGVVRLTTDAVYRRGGRAFARLLRSAGGDVTEYELDWRPRGGAALAGHVVDLPLLFPDAEAWAGARLIGREDPADLVELGAGLRAVWGAFARGEPLPHPGAGPVRLRLGAVPPRAPLRTPSMSSTPRPVRASASGSSRLDPGRAMALIAPIDLPSVFLRWGPFPAVVTVEHQTGTWDRPGRRRRTRFSDGGSAVETLVDYEPGRRFAYELRDFTTPFGRLVRGVQGEWTFEAEPGGCRVTWAWSFLPRRFARPLLAAVVVPLFRGYMRRVVDASIALAERLDLDGTT